MPTSSATLNQALYDAAQSGDAALLSSLLARGADAGHGMSMALRVAAHEGNAECVRLLAPISDAKCLSSQALSLAAAGGHAECVGILLPFSDAQGSYFKALANAACENHYECVGLLLAAGWDRDPFLSSICASSAASGHSESVAVLAAACSIEARQVALECAAEEGHASCVRMLLSEFDLAKDCVKAANKAARHGHFECCALFAAACPLSIARSMAATAASFGHEHVLVFLLSLPGLQMDGSAALIAAATGGHLACAEALFPTSDLMARRCAPLRGAIASGNARLVESILAREPRCGDVIELATMSRRRASPEIANILTAFKEAREISRAAHEPKTSKNNAPRI